LKNFLVVIECYCFKTFVERENLFVKMGNLLIKQRKLANLEEEHPKNSSLVTVFLLLHPLNQMLLSNANAYYKCLYGDALSEEGQK